MNLQIENPYKISDNAFVITVNGQEYEYEIPEDKDIDQIIDRIETWLGRGEDSWGGLYDWIKASFKMVGEYEEPIEEDDEEDLEDPLLAPSSDTFEEPEVDIPSDIIDINEPIDEDHSFEMVFKIEEDNVNISIDDWAADFEIVDTADSFTDAIHDKIKEEMNLKDRTTLLVELIRNLDTDDEVNYYNLINLLLNTDIELVDSFDKAEEELIEPEPEELPTEEPEELPEPVNDSEILTLKGTFKKALIEDSLWNTSNKSIDYGAIQDREDSEEDGNEEELELEDLVNNESFLEDLVSLNLSLYAITGEDKQETLYFIGGIGDRGDKYSLSYSDSEPIDIPDIFEECKDMDVCLNNIRDLNTVVDYIDRLLDIVYNQELKKVHKNIGGDNE